MTHSDCCGCVSDLGHDHKHGPGHRHGHCSSRLFRRFLTKAEIREKLEEYRDRLERELAGVGERIEELEAATPLTHIRFLGHPGGAFYGFDQYAKDSNMFRERDSGIEGLFFAGAWAAGGGFQPTLQSGVQTSQAIMKSLDRR